ncbi:Tricarboxylate transport protein TctB [Kocuria sp. WRN011]|uniref:tripartite tricarboxylate transporter TctB family protein n=1 Tax=Kocuria TaxID=57493 RepID=UPI000BAF543A|nr:MULTISPECIES: tripartite tricarboxylate transporter TctB family protein [Kocuria]MCT1802002.1 tripartite tricarboxylate transporter TctB family protein [Kocuria carniphila]PBB07425.1 Tricarboxylate transport protein TctB [Kocuria sp. WRN011]
MSHASVSESSAPAPRADSERPVDRSSRSAGSLLQALTMPLVLAAFATYLLVGMLMMEVPDSVDFPGPRFFPAIITGVIYVLVVVEVISIFRHWSSGSLGTTDDAAPAAFSWRSLVWVIGGFLAFSLLLEFLGWILGAALLFWCVARGFGSKRPLFSLIVGLTVSSIAYIAFDMALGLSLPSGLLGGGF